MITRRIAVGLLLLSVFVGAEGAFAVEESESGKTISVLLLNSVGGALALDDRGPSAACVFGFIGFDPDTNLGKSFYAALLTAKTAGSPISILYDRQGTDCTLTQILF